MKPRAGTVTITRILTDTGTSTVDRFTRNIVVAGTVFPPNSRVQVFIRGGDAEWYLQGNAEVHGRKWWCRGKVGPYLGTPQATGGLYPISAVLGSTGIRHGQHAPAEEVFPGKVWSPWQLVIRTDA